MEYIEKIKRLSFINENFKNEQNDERDDIIKFLLDHKIIKIMSNDLFYFCDIEHRKIYLEHEIS